MEGKTRLNFFCGVATVVTKLFNVIEKDIRRALLPRWLTRDLLLLHLQLQNLFIVPTARDPRTSLALSSRNAYLSSHELEDAAPALCAALQAAKSGSEANASKADCIARAGAVIEETKRKLRDSADICLDYIDMNAPESSEALNVDEQAGTMHVERVRPQRTRAPNTGCPGTQGAHSDVTEPISAQPQQRFSGMTLPVAEFLANNVFCLLDNHKDDSKLISARAFGNWIKDLPNLLGGPSIWIAFLPFLTTPAVYVFGTMSSLGRHEHESPITLLPVPDGETEQESAMDSLHDHHDQHDDDAEVAALSGTTATSSTSPSSARDVTLKALAQASQALAREIFRTSRDSATTPSDIRPVPYHISPGTVLPPIVLLNASVPPLSKNMLYSASPNGSGAWGPSPALRSSRHKLAEDRNDAMVDPTAPPGTRDPSAAFRHLVPGAGDQR
ncbi:hypothetical protein BD311DRAFT_802929 [Dichomitus squalens]|uniref:Pantoate-activating enzyme n=1 Tax=Dichomitus squalens TaxID=114155 RepID=A0A4Q9N286_9APHY|nr:hypothetical protein BD311DRAFT_812422 [Dichomitus squalens]TBU33948.1 hypothetical protein BD311DRAFT_802929 [Dichomitus squalens]